MVNQEARKKAARALRRFLDCETSNEEFDSEYVRIGPAWNRSKDRAITAVYGFAWNLYDDFKEHKLEAEWELDKQVKEIAERCVLFLGTDCEYEWKKSEFIGIDWRRVFSGFLPWIKWEADTLKRFEANLGEPAGDASVWPFYQAADFHDALSRKQKEKR
ncbi:MAG: hypothetical protein P4K83_10145 [Terracidiphilus sp.]|nr:hypothetical protein [Terracidiphilus sp.]